MIPELFLACALSLPVASGRNGILPFKEMSLQEEYVWVSALLAKIYPKDEFLVIPAAVSSPGGWVPVSFFWHDYSIYRRKSA
jgi:hypothetical protein